MVALRTISRHAIVNVGPCAPWGGPGHPPVVMGKAALDAVDTGYPVALKVGEAVFPRLRQNGNPDAQYEPLHELIKRVAEQVGTEQVFELQYA